MAQKQRDLDLWILQTNTVYRKVPYMVVTNWIQEGRLLTEDKVRPAGTEKWYVLGAVAALAAFLPRAEPFQAEDQAEALEPVEVGVSWGAGRPDEEEDVDMIPLIDISLVLLIFFMMTAAVSSGILSPIETPAAQYQLMGLSEGSYWVGIDTKDAAGNRETGPDGRPAPWYSLGLGEKRLVDPSRDPAAVTEELRKRLAKYRDEVKVRIRADKRLDNEVVSDMTLALQRLQKKLNDDRGGGARSQLKLQVEGEVSEMKR
jgi:biopolymer transport protein ExbD